MPDQALVFRMGVDVADAQRKVAEYAKDVGQRMSDITTAATKASGDVSAKMSLIGEAASTTAERTKALNGTFSLSNVVRQLDSVVAKTKDAQGQLAGLQSQFTSLQSKFAQGQSLGFADVGGMLMQAGSIRGALTSAGGLAGAGVLAAGAAAATVQHYAGIADVADKAHASAQEVEGLSRVLAKLGVDATASNGIIAAFGEKLRDGGQAGAEFRAHLDGMGIALSSADGSARSTVAVLADYAQKIKAASDDSERLKLATAAVGAELAGPFLTAVNQSKTGLSDLANASMSAGASFTNDLAKAAQMATKGIAELGRRADQTYSSIKALVGVASDLDKVKAAQERVDQARAAYDRAGTVPDRMGTTVFPDQNLDLPPITGKDEAARALAAAQIDLKKIQDAVGATAKTVDASRLGFVGPNMTPTVLGDVQGPQLPAGWTAPVADAASGGGGRGRGGGGSGSDAEDDRAQRVLERLRDQLAATQAITGETGSLAEKRRLVAELVNAGVTAESAEGQEIAGLVRQIDQQAAAQRRVVEVMNEVRTAANSVESALDQWVVQGRNFSDVIGSLVKQLESQALKSAFNAITGLGGNGGSGGGGGGLFGGLFSSIGSGLSGMFSGGIGSFFEGIASFLPALALSTGGRAGIDGTPMTVPASAFVGAPKFAFGGGIPSILHAGEIVLNAAQQKNVVTAMGSGDDNGPRDLHVHLTSIGKRSKADMDAEARFYAKRIGEIWNQDRSLRSKF